MYYLFAWDNYYPGGGINDLRMAYLSAEEATEAASKLKSFDRWQVWSVDEHRIIDEGGYD